MSDIENRIERLEAAILGSQGHPGLVAEVAAIRAILERIEEAESRAAGAAIHWVCRSECDRRHAESAAWARAIVPAFVGAALGLIVSLLMRGVA